MLKNILFLSGLITLALSFTSAQPKIKILPGTTLDLEDLYKGQKIERIVTVKNAGTDTLRISNVKAQCGCTATFMSEKNLGPSDTGQLSIIFDTQNQLGKVTKQVFITSNDTSQPKLTIQFTANVIEVLKMSPPSFVFDKAVVDSSYTKAITISNPSRDRAIKILSVEPKFENLKVTMMKNTLMPGEETQIQAVFTSTKAGTAQGFIELMTDHPMQKKFEIRVFSWVNRK